jgi:hypothetical protein
METLLSAKHLLSFSGLRQRSGRSTLNQTHSHTVLPKGRLRINGINQIYLTGGGKGKASGVHNLATFLNEHHHLNAENIHGMEEIDASNMSTGELLAIARKMDSQDYS